MTRADRHRFRTDGLGLRLATAAVVILFTVPHVGCLDRLENPEGQEILLASIAATGSLLYAAENVLLAAAVTRTGAADDAGKALIRVQTEITAGVGGATSAINRAQCPCGGQCACSGCGAADQKDARAACNTHLQALVESFKAGCPKPTIAKSTQGRQLVLDLGPHCQGCTVHGRRLGGRAVIEVKSDKAPWDIRFDFGRWVAADRFAFKVDGSYDVEPACFVTPAPGIQGDRFDHRGALNATLSADLRDIILSYSGMQRVDHINRLTHNNLASSGSGVVVRLLDPERGLAGGLVVRGTETWTTGEGNSRWKLRIQDAVIEPGRPVPRSGVFIVDAPPNRTDVRLEFAATGSVTEVTLVGVSRRFRFTVMPDGLTTGTSN